MDSCVCAALTARDHDLYALHFSYGQRTETHELASAQQIAQLTGAKAFLPLKIELFRQIGGSALTDPAIPVPEASRDRIRRSQPSAPKSQSPTFPSATLTSSPPP